MHEKKLRQVTDTIHGTIYLSSLESELISTPFFYRLHDIYQSSTVYITYPCNRTKRYEHSLGTMELTSQMFYASVTNADKVTIDNLFRNFKSYIIQIADKVCNKGNNLNARLFVEIKDDISEIFGKHYNNIKTTDELINIIEKDLEKLTKQEKNELTDSALDYYQYFSEKSNIGNSNSALNWFIYRCLLQSLRIVALFHDVGHPPFSHIMESVLKKLFNSNYGTELKRTDESIKDKQKTLKNSLSNYCKKSANSSEDMILGKIKIKDNTKPHERISIEFLKYALFGVIKSIIKSVVASDCDESTKSLVILYYLIVSEFTVAIQANYNLEFHSLHAFIDSYVDADRLDYIKRDSKNSGVEWGDIPYKRLIQSIRLFYREDNRKGYFVYAFPRKLEDDIADLIITRYKIYARINFHHRNVKSTMALQQAVLDIARDYLTKNDDDCISPDIHILWTSLSSSIGDISKRIIQWNDSWLISTLHKALVDMYMSNNNNPPREDLEEFLLYRRKYNPLLKRDEDEQKLVELIFNSLNLSLDNIESRIKNEYTRYHQGVEQYDKLSEVEKESLMFISDSKNAEDALKRLKNLKKAYVDKDLETLFSILPEKSDSFENVCCRILDKMKINNMIQDYRIFINTWRGETGLPKINSGLDAIYLYQEDQIDPLDPAKSLVGQINILKKSVPWVFVYYTTNASLQKENIQKDELLEFLAKELALELSEKFNQLFPNDRLQMNER